MTDTPPALSPAGLTRFSTAACEPPFRGSIIENCARFRFRGSGYDALPKEQDGHFELQTARQVAGPMLALTDDAVRITHVIGATQVLKSIVGDAWVIYCFEHILLPMLVLFEDDDKADLFCSRRLMETLLLHPEISKLVADSKRESRHNITGTWLKIAGAELLVAGMNEGNVSTLTWPLVWVSEAWQHANDGLLFKAFKRTDRYPDTYKILNESQASLVGTDLHAATQQAHQVPLTWKCPACGGEQTWEWQHWNHRRPDDFKVRQRNTVATCTIGGQVALIQDASPAPGTFAGMRWNMTGAVLDEEKQDERTIEQKARAAYWECIWCGHHIHDTKAERMAICETYSQDYRIVENGIARTPWQVCFTLPFEAAWDNRFEKTVASFLSAKDAKRAGNPVKLRDWFMAERALFYDPNIEHREISISPGSYDPNKLIENELSRDMAVDCQQDQDHMEKTGKSITGWFWYIVRIYDNQGNSKQLARGYVKSWEDWIKVQKHWKVPNDRVMIDIDQWPTQIMQRAAEEREIIRVEKPLPPFYLREKIVTWYLLAAENRIPQFKHKDNQLRPWSPEQPLPVPLYDGNQKRRTIYLKKIRYTKKTISLQLDAIRSGAPGMPKFEVLSRENLKLPDGTPDKLTLDMETGNLTYDKQLSSQYYVPEENKFKELRPGDHFRWCEEALLVRQALDGRYGHISTFAE